MKATWLFEIDGTYYYGMEAYTYGGTDYAAKIIPESFSGIHMRVDIVSRLYAPNEAEFDISNVSGALSEADFQDVRCCVGLLLDGVLCRRWCLHIETAVEAYGKIHCTCVDPITRYLKGDFPVTPAVSANFPSDDAPEDTEARVPITLGTAFIPVSPFLSAGSRYYCLGKTGYTYTVNKVRSPRQWDFVSEWDNSYTYTQSDKAGEQITVKATQMTIADSDGDGIVDANGVWIKSGAILPPLVQFSGPYSSATGPGSWIYAILQLFGVASGYLDSASFTAVNTARSGVSWGGGFWKPESKESILSSLLSQCDSFLSMDLTVKINPFVKTSVETFTRAKIKSMSFSPARMGRAEVDGGTIRFAWNGEPQDELTGEAAVGLYGAQTTINDPSGGVFEYKYGYNNQHAQAFGILYFQKKFDQKYSVRFSTEMSKIAARATLIPGQVVTVYEAFSGLKVYGDSKPVVITSIHIKPDLTVDIDGTVYNHLEQFSDISKTAITPDSSLGSDFEFLSLTKLVTISGETVFKYGPGETVPVPTSVTLTAVLSGDLTGYLWQYWNGTAWADLAAPKTTNTYALAYNNAAWGTNQTLRVKCLSGTYSGEITIAKVADGETGQVNLGIPQMNREISVLGAGLYGVARFGNQTSIRLSDLGFAVGDEIGFSVLARFSGTNAATGQCLVTFYGDPPGSAITYTAGPATTIAVGQTAYERIYRTATIPAGAVYAWFGVHSATITAGVTLYGKQGMVFRGHVMPDYAPCVRDGISTEYIFRRMTTSATPSLTTTAVQTDDYVPSGWTDDSAGVSASYPWEWISSRNRGADGLWGVFAAPTLWSVYTFDAITPVFSNHAHSVPCAVDGTPSSYAGSRATLQIYDGTTLLNFHTVAAAGRFLVGTPTIDPAGGITVGGRSGSGTTTCTIADHSGMSAAVDVVTISYPISITKFDGSTVALTIKQTITKAKTGATGADGVTGAVGPGVVYRGEYVPGDGKVFYNNAVRRDIVKYSGAYYLYAGTDASTQPTWVAGNWAAFGATFSSVATAILLAEDATVLRWLTIGSGGGIRSDGKDTYTDTTAGFWLGYDSGAYKFHIGDASSALKWDGSSLTIDMASGAGLVINSGAGITIKAGGDITLNTTSYLDQGVIKFVTQNRVFTLGPNWADTVSIMPDTDSTGAFYIGDASVRRFDNIVLAADTVFMVGGSIEAPVGWDGYDFYNTLGTGDLGKSTNEWRDLFMNGKIILDDIADPAAVTGRALIYGFLNTNVEVRVQDSAGNKTTISPHHFSMFTPDEAYLFPWSYYSENSFLGRRINVDMYGAIAAIEALTGKKFIHIEEMAEDELLDWDTEQARQADKRKAQIAEFDALPEKDKARGKRPEPLPYEPMPEYLQTRIDHKKRGKNGA